MSDDTISGYEYVARLKAENDRLRETLRMFANDDTWKRLIELDVGTQSVIGTIKVSARAALVDIDNAE